MLKENYLYFFLPSCFFATVCRKDLTERSVEIKFLHIFVTLDLRERKLTANCLIKIDFANAGVDLRRATCDEQDFEIISLTVYTGNEDLQNASPITRKQIVEL